MSHIISSAYLNYAVPSKIGGTGSGVKIFPSILSSTAPAIIQMLEQANGQVVTLTASGTLTVAGAAGSPPAATINPVLQSGTSLTSASNTTVSTLTAAQGLANGNYPFAFLAELQGDSVSGIVQVVFSQFVCNGVVTAQSAMTNTLLTGVTFGNIPLGSGFFKPENPLNLVFGLNFGTSAAANAASLLEYQIEA